MLSRRLAELKDGLFSDRREISLERAVLYTDSYKRTEGQSTIIRRAKAFENILDNVKISIRPGELILGNRTVKPRSGIVSPEMDPYWFLGELDTIEGREQDPFYISEADKKLYRDELYPYWKGRSLKDLINTRLNKDILDAEKENIFALNQTDKGQGHIIPSYDFILNNGMDGMIERINESAERSSNDFYRAAMICYKALKKHILRYAALAYKEAAAEGDERRKKELLDLGNISKKVAGEKPDSFLEACQLFWYIDVALQYESNASSISPGRFDQYMYPFFKKDLENGRDLACIKEVLRSLWIKMNDVVLLRSRESAKYFAGFPTGYTIILGGLDENGRCSVNNLSYEILDTFADIRLPQPNLGVRVNELTPKSFLIKTAEVIRLGTGIPQIFNDEVIIPGYLSRGVDLKDARDYSVVGCVELTIPGKTYGLHDIALFNLLKVMELTLKQKKDDIKIFDDIIRGIKSNIDIYAGLMADGANVVDISHKDFAPIPFLSCIMQDCLERGLDVTQGGTKYNFSGVQGIGIANLSDSLYALKKAVFEEKRYGLGELIDILDSNYENKNDVRSSFINKYEKYGNDDDEVDFLGSEILSYYCGLVTKYKNPRGGFFNPGSYTVSAHIPLGAAVGATPDGRLKGEQLADGGLSPMAGRDKKGPTAVLKSVSKLDNYLTTNGSLLNLKFSPKALEGSAGLSKMVDFLKAFMRLKIQHVQFNVISAGTLKDAQKHPDKYKNLVVRVAGYSAVFVELNKAVQDDIIARTEHVI